MATTGRILLAIIFLAQQFWPSSGNNYIPKSRILSKDVEECNGYIKNLTIGLLKRNYRTNKIMQKCLNGGYLDFKDLKLAKYGIYDNNFNQYEKRKYFLDKYGYPENYGFGHFGLPDDYNLKRFFDQKGEYDKFGLNNYLSKYNLQKYEKDKYGYLENSGIGHFGLLDDVNLERFFDQKGQYNKFGHNNYFSKYNLQKYLSKGDKFGYPYDYDLRNYLSLNNNENIKTYLKQKESEIRRLESTKKLNLKKLLQKRQQGCFWRGKLYSNGEVINDLYQWWFNKICSKGKMVVQARQWSDVVKDKRYKKNKKL